MARDAPQVDAYGEGGFRVSGARREGSLLIVEDQAYDWPVRIPAELDVASLAPVLSAGRSKVEFLLLGMGRANALPAREVRDAVRAAGLGLEFMDTASAARLYNVLTSEGRGLAAALIAI